MKAYRSHKTVLAVPIEYVGPLTLRTEDGEGVAISELGTKATPQVGDYFIIYEDGYKSFCPKAQFEAGYTAVKKENPNNAYRSVPPWHSHEEVEQERNVPVRSAQQGQ